MKKILIQKSDIKSNSWKKIAEKENIGKLFPIKKSAVYMPFVLLQHILLQEKPYAIIVRYLNDYQSLAKTLIRLNTDITTVIIAKVFCVKLYWMCHNVDNETVSYYPYITRLRRTVVKKASEKIFVMDKMLIEYAEKKLNISRNKIYDISFGRTDYLEKINICNDKCVAVIDDINKWKNNKIKKRKGGVCCGMWIGNVEKKNIDGLYTIMEIISKNKNVSYCNDKIVFVVIGPVGKKINNELYTKLKYSDDIKLIDEFISIPPSMWNDIADFIFKPNDDLSVNLTLYNAALAEIPIISKKRTFVSKMIEYYNIGYSLCYENIEIKNIVHKVKNWETYKSKKFIKEKNWIYGAKKIFE
ncbi:hypothetical protein [Natronogracilivirga saccharolytica]|uniref:Glycosyltransferase n=1 Tax=Natronogracilivirga saccharolytica TaxID=2812953 RepID=A0A8J7S8R3_9BACT|nr:hypothetical protein [Natronogracilivirga saccharolytica]MBP3194023.1 hypothetical protein [Natronogracilivirga saccharolytica]